MQIYLFVFVKTHRQEKQQSVNHLAKVTDKYMKDFSSLPVTTEQVQKSYCPTILPHISPHIHTIIPMKALK